MNREELRTEARTIFGETDSSNSSISDSTLNAWINEAYRYVVTRLETIPIKERKYTTASEVTLNSSTLTVDRAKLLASSGDYVELDVIDIDELMAIDPDWENTATAQPTHLVRKDAFTVIMYPYPNAAHDAIAEGLITYGMEFATLDSDAASPNLPLNMHDILPHYVAYRAFARLQDPNRSGAELMLVNGLLKSQKHITTKFSDKRGWRMMESDESSGA